MNLFIEPVHDGGGQAFADASRANRVSGGSAGGDRGVFRPPAASAGEDVCGTTGSLPITEGERSSQSHQYRDEIAYDRRRSKRFKRRGALRILAMLIAIPVVLAVAFIVSYVLTLVAGGATPEEIVELLHNLWNRLYGAAYHLLGMV